MAHRARAGSARGVLAGPSVRPRRPGRRATWAVLRRGGPRRISVPFLENGLRFVADLGSGQKTGFFLDQRDNRSRLRALARGKTVLNLFSYSGAFSVAALAGGATRAVDVDSSEAALVLARENRRANGSPGRRGGLSAGRRLR